MMYVAAWVTPRKCSSHWLMVEHQERGWELPGGGIEVDETPTEAAIREVLEETGLLSSVVSAPQILDEDGFVIHLETDEGLTEMTWSSKDPSIVRVQWFENPPLKLAWGVAELRSLSQRFGGPLIT